MKTIKILWLVVTTLMIMANFAFAQTWTQTSAPSNSWEAVALSADGSKLIATSLSFIYGISTNSGTTWITNTEPQNGSSYGSWTSIASSADGTKFAATSANVIWVSTDSGTTWLSNNVPAAVSFGAVSLSADGNELVAVDGEPGNNYSGSIYISTNGGINWTSTIAPTNVWTAIALSADGSKLVAVSGGNNNLGSIYASTNFGLTWTPTGAPAGNGWATVASSTDGSKLVAASGVAFLPPHPDYGGVYTSTNFGMTWTSNNVPFAQWERVASSADGTKLIAAAIAPSGLIYTSTNSGATWTSNNVPSKSWSGVASSADGSKLVLVVNGDGIWTSQTMPSPQLNLAPVNTNFTLSWTIPSTNFVLQQSTDLASWADVTNAPALNLTNLQNQVTLSPSNSSSFYRLKTP